MESLNGYDTDYCQCRAMGHSWSITEADRKPSWGFLIAIECDRCQMKRLDTIDQLGKVSSRQYKQPEGYKNPDVTDRSAYRREMITRILKNKSK